MEEDILEREDLFDWCGEIFDNLENPNPKDDELTLIRFIEGMTRDDVDFLSQIFEKSELKLGERTANDVFFEFMGMVIVLSFAMGFGMGTWHDCSDPDLRKKIEKVRISIKENELFRFAPKARA